MGTTHPPVFYLTPTAHVSLGAPAGVLVEMPTPQTVLKAAVLDTKCPSRQPPHPPALPTSLLHHQRTTKGTASCGLPCFGTAVIPQLVLAPL